MKLSALIGVASILLAGKASALGAIVHLQYEGQNIGSIELHSGLAARDELKKCLAPK